MLVGDDSASNIQHGSHACRGRGEGAEAGRGESGPARKHAHVLPSVVEGQFVDRGAAATLVISSHLGTTYIGKLRVRWVASLMYTQPL